MNSLTVYQDNYAHQTLIPNRFIDEYMIDANDAQIKIYLYLLRLLHAHKPTSISDLADVFNFTEKDVLRALRYWEKKGLLSLDYDEEKNLCGIHLGYVQDSAAPSEKEHFSAPVPREASRESSVAEIVPIASVPQRAQKDNGVSSFELPEKPTYSADDLATFKKRSETKQLIFAIETYLGKPLSANDLRTIFYLSDELHFSSDLIDYLIQYCVERGKKDFRYIEKVAVSWAENQIRTPKDAQRFSSKYDRTVYHIMQALGKGDNSPTEKEVSYIQKWTSDYGFDIDIITEACERTVLSTDRHRFEYADGILKNWKKNQVSSKNDISSLDNAHKSAKPTASDSTSKKNQFNQFQHNSYDFDELEKKILSN